MTLQDVPTWKWLVGALGTCVALLVPVTAWMASVAASANASATELVAIRTESAARGDKASREIDRVSQALVDSNTRIANELRVSQQVFSERLVRVETYTELTREEMSIQRAALLRIEAKVDKIPTK